MSDLLNITLGPDQVSSIYEALHSNYYTTETMRIERIKNIISSQISKADVFRLLYGSKVEEIRKVISSVLENYAVEVTFDCINPTEVRFNIQLPYEDFFYIFYSFIDDEYMASGTGLPRHKNRDLLSVLKLSLASRCESSNRWIKSNEFKNESLKSNIAIANNIISSIDELKAKEAGK